jgi:hypothetical protein
LCLIKSATLIVLVDRVPAAFCQMSQASCGGCEIGGSVEQGRVPAGLNVGGHPVTVGPPRD